jgi:hypothetical protein
MRYSSLAALAGAALTLAACQGDGNSGQPVTSTASPAARAGEPVPGFRCPAAGACIEYAQGGGLTFRGVDPADPQVCPATGPNGEQQRRLYNFWILPVTDQGSVRAGAARLYPIAEGKGSEFTFIGTTASTETFRYRENWRVVRMETLEVGAGSRACWATTSMAPTPSGSTSIRASG